MEVFHAQFKRRHDGMLSIDNIHRLSCEHIKNLGVEVGIEREEDELLGWAAFMGSDVLEESLHICDKHGPPWHAEIVGWPDDKGKRIRIQKNLAQRVKENDGGVRIPGGIPCVKSPE